MANNGSTDCSYAHADRFAVIKLFTKTFLKKLKRTTKITIPEIQALKNKRKITVLTAYDYPTALLVEQAGIDIILVGDSLANVVLGLDSTTKVGMTEMLHHTCAVTGAVKNTIVIADMPYSAYQTDPTQALVNAQRFITGARAQGVKLEWFEHCLEVTQQLVHAGIPVMGHIGLTPQTADKIGGYVCQGKDALTAQRLIDAALALEAQGCFAIVLECIPEKISALITRKLKIPTIGIGAGIHCDGQVLVINDLLGLNPGHTPKFAKKYAHLALLILKAVEDFKNDVLTEKFPAPENSFSIKDEEFKKINEI